MKKIFLILAVLCGIGLVAGCKSDIANEQNTPESSKGRDTFEDVEITADEFDSAGLYADQWQYIRTERELTVEDTVIVREWFTKHGLEFAPELMDECGFFAFEGDRCIEICAGDYCETRFLDDTTIIVGYNIVLGSEAVGSFVLAYECGDMMEEPAYIYIYPMNLVAIEEGKPYIGKPYIYETTPKWCPTGDRQFWGGGNWFYVEGFNRNKERVYHKVRPISK